MSMDKLIKKDYDGSYCVTFRNIRRLRPDKIKEIFSVYGVVSDVIAVGSYRFVLYKNYEDARKCIEIIEHPAIKLEDHEPRGDRKKHSSSSNDSEIIINKSDKFIRKEWKGYSVVFHNHCKLDVDTIKNIFRDFGALYSVRKRDDDEGNRYVHYKNYSAAKHCVEKIEHPDVRLVEHPVQDTDDINHGWKKSCKKRKRVRSSDRFSGPSDFMKQTKKGSFSFNDYLEYSENSTCNENKKTFECMKENDNDPAPDCGEDISFNDECLMSSIVNETNGLFSLSGYLGNSKACGTSNELMIKDNSEENASYDDELNLIIKKANESFSIIEYLEKLKVDNTGDENE